MKHGKISNVTAPFVAFDYDALVLPPESMRKQAVLKRLAKWPKINAKFQPVTLFWSPLDPRARIAGWWLINQGVNIAVIVRRPYCTGLPEIVRKILDDFPASRFHLVQDNGDLVRSGMEIKHFCNQNMIYRLFTRDVALCQYLPRNLAFYVREWDETLLL